MRSGLTALQTNILDSDVYSDLTWLFEIDLGNTGSVDYYWSTKYKVWSGNTYSDVNGSGDSFILNFTPISLKKGNADAGVLLPSGMTFVISNPNSSLDPDDFIGAAITVRLVIKANLAPIPSSDVTESSDVASEAEVQSEAEISAWGFVVRNAWTVYQKLTLSCVDWLQDYLDGSYPNTPLVSTLWPAANIEKDSICVPKIFGIPYFPIRWTKASTTGDDLYVLGEYNTGETHTILECRDPTDIGKGVYLESETNHTFTVTENKLAEDGNYYSTATFVIVSGGSNIFWNRNKHPDMPCKYSNSATAAIRNPIEIIRDVLLDFGVPAGKINTAAYNTAYNTWHDRGLRFDVPFYYKRERMDVLAQLLMLCNTSLIVRDQLYFKVNSTSSQHTINNSWVLKIGESNEGEGTFNYQSLVTNSNKDSGHVIYRESDKSIDDPQKLLVPAKNTTLQISDITIDATYISVQLYALKIAIMALQRLLLVEGVVSANLKAKCLQLEVGDMVTIEGSNFNAIANYDALITDMTINRDGSVQISAKTFSAALDDWYNISPTGYTPIEDDSTGGFFPVYAGDEAVNLDGESLNWVWGSIKFQPGADITLVSSTTDAAELRLTGPGAAYDFNAKITTRTDAQGNELKILPYETNPLDFLMIGGYDNDFVTWCAWGSIFNYALQNIYLDVNDQATGGNDIEVRITPTYMQIQFDGAQYYKFTDLGLLLSNNKVYDCAEATKAFDDVYADDFQNVADFFFLDDKNDLDTIMKIGKSDLVDERTGLTLIDDTTLEEWLLTRNKKTGEIARDAEGNPYLSLKMLISLLIGAIKELNKKKADK